MNVILQTPRLIVREFAPADEDLFIELYRDDDVTRYVSKQTEEQRRKKFVESVKEYKNGLGMARWGVFNPGDDDFIGVAMLKPADSDPTRIELGYVLAKKYWGVGMATELANALVKYGFEQKGLTEICACTNPENIASQNVLLKAGMFRDGNVFWHESDLPFFRITK